LSSTRVEGRAANGIVIIVRNAVFDFFKTGEAQMQKQARNPLVRIVGHPSVWIVRFVEVRPDGICGYLDFFQVSKVNSLPCFRLNCNVFVVDCLKFSVGYLY